MYFKHVAEGTSVVVRTPFFKGRDPQEVLQEWMPHLEKLSDDWPSLLDFEIDLSKKVGPLSVMKPLDERMSDMEAYYECINKDSTPIPQYAIDAVVEEFEGVSGLRQRSVMKTVEKMKLSTNSGSPFFTKRRNVLKQTLPNPHSWVNDVDSDSDTQISNVDIVFGDGAHDYSRWKACAVLGWRGQEGGPNPEDVKQRVVWMFPFSININELQVYQPLIESCQKLNLVPAWVGMDAVDDAITQLFDTKNPHDLIVCTDFSKFDQHFNPDMSECARSILRELLTHGDDSLAWLNEVFPIKYMIPIMYQEGELITGLHGMASGSGGTNVDETLTHRALQHQAAIEAGTTLNTHSMCLGDDGIITYPGITVEQVTSVYSSHGQDMNLDKQYASAVDCTFLRRWHHQDYRIDGKCVGVYSTARALGRLFYQERFYDPDVWGPKMVALRQISILENIKFHPLREEFVDFCMKGDKFRLGLDIPGFLDDIASISREATEHMPDFLGYVKSQQKSTSINDWWIVKYLKSKR